MVVEANLTAALTAIPESSRTALKDKALASVHGASRGVHLESDRSDIQH